MKKVKKVLIVDDSKLARLTLSRLLRERNLGVVEAASVAECMGILEANDNIDAIFMDVMMPEKDGFEGLDIIKSNSRFKHIPCSMYSGELSVETQQKAIDSGAQAYLFKPASGENIESVLDALESGSVAKEVRQFTSEGAKKSQRSDMSQVISAMNLRTKNLARVITRERKEKEALYETFDKRLTVLSDNIAHTRILKKSFEREEIERQRVESELRAEIAHLGGSVKKLLLISGAAIVFAVIALVLAFVA